ncbi:hypothetical protein COCCU_13415 [Corynebacterium occultum]|uniref:Uncharacterized protein n=1 Tax=Corynebacterium occultum TaxID=2675219 RepID=A0A6B8VSK8_9CORY|nr:hypothetical protein [Corynebacterium occultum]QGU08582.1 hypothetical protein COCCU_13415 [Corynebacterium occultum]
MYGWYWRNLPGRWPLKTLITLVLGALIFLLLMEVVFPWISPMLPYNEVAV